MSKVLIHIGFPKAGSTYLQTWFGENPGCFYNGKSIAGFSNAHDISKYAVPPDPIHEWFVLSNEDLSVWRGEPDIVGLKSTKLYDFKGYQSKLCQTLYALYPGAKVMIITRGCTTLFPSFYSQYLCGGGTSVFSELMQNYGQFFSLGYDYTHIIELYRSTFNAGNVKVLPYELLRADPATFISEIEAWMGISKPFKITSEKINASLDNKTLTAYRKVSRLLYQLIKPLPYSFQKYIYGYYMMVLNGKKPHPFMKFIARFANNEINLDGLDEVMKTLKGKAEILRHEEIYQPYLKEYLL
jgi:hypothetical protein